MSPVDKMLNSGSLLAEVAVVFDWEQLTYRQLNERAHQVAHYLRSLRVEQKIPFLIHRLRQKIMMKFEDLTQHEVEALKQKYNFADAHTHQSQSPSQLKIVRSLPELWLEAEKTKQETLNNKFIKTFYKMRGLEAALNPNNVMLY